jgi:hypothetical protein
MNSHRIGIDSTSFHTSFRKMGGRKGSSFVFSHLHADSQGFGSANSLLPCITDLPKLLGRKTKPLPSQRVVSGLPLLRSKLFGALLLVVFTNVVGAHQTLVIATPLVGQSPVQTNAASCEALALYVQMLEILLVLVLIVAVVALALLIRLYRKTKF